MNKFYNLAKPSLQSLKNEKKKNNFVVDFELSNFFLWPNQTIKNIFLNDSDEFYNVKACSLHAN